MISYITIKQSTHDIEYFIFLRCFHENMIDARCRKLYDSRWYGYVGQIFKGHLSWHVEHHIFIRKPDDIDFHISC